MDNCYNLIFCVIAKDNLTPPHTPALPDFTSSGQRLVKKKATSSSPSNGNSDVPMKLFDKEERSTNVSERENQVYFVHTYAVLLCKEDG